MTVELMVMQGTIADALQSQIKLMAKQIDPTSTSEQEYLF